MMRRGGLFVGITLLVVGLLLLLSDLGVIAVDVWSAVWAVLLIALGLSILWGVVGGTHPVEGDEVAIPLEGASRARVRARHGAGCLRVTAGAASDVLLEGTFSSGLDYRARRVGEELDVEMSPRGFPFTVAPWNWGRGGLGWILALNGQIPLSLAFETGASDASLDLRNLQVTDLRLATGASSVNVTLPAGAGHTRVHIEAGAASVSIGVPTSVAARVRFEGGLAAIDVDESRFPRTGGVYQSPDYDSAENKVDIEAKAGAGSLNVH
jgi:hypothetical protein